MPLDFTSFAQSIGLVRSMLVVAPHPDDETLGCGGLIALAAAAGLEIRSVLVTDGGASHPNSAKWPRERLIETRKLEVDEALQRLGAGQPAIPLNLPDAETLSLPEATCQRAVGSLAAMIDRQRPDIVLTTWRREPHCDHQFSYRLVCDAVASAECQPRIVEYMVWTFPEGPEAHWPLPHEADEVQLDVSTVQLLKQTAIAAHATQLGGVIDDDASGFTLTPQHLARMMVAYERYFVPRATIAVSPRPL